MKKFKLAALLLGIVANSVMYGQYADFDLSKYKLPDINTKRLDFNFDMNNSATKNSSQYAGIGSSDTKQNNLDGYVDLTYNQFINSEKYQGNLSMGMDINPALNTSDVNGTTSKTREIDADIYFYGETRFFNKKMDFLEVDPYISLGPIGNEYFEQNSTTSSREDNENSFYTRISVPVSIGHGRIEPVEDARLAIYILEELDKIGVISGTPSDETVIEMAKTISKIKNQRFFDSRIRKIRELQVIDSFLVANNIVKSNDINYFAVLNDNWDYAYGPARESGFYYNVGIDNGFNLSRKNTETILNDNTYESVYKSNIYQVGGFVNVKYAKPINLYWQTAANFQASYNLEYTRDPDDIDNQTVNYNTNIISTQLALSLQYLPNSRTSMKFSFNSSFSNLRGDRTSGGMVPLDYFLKGTSLSLIPKLDIFYYVSPQLQVQLNSSFTKNNTWLYSEYESTATIDKDIQSYYTNNISVKLIYSIF